MTRTQLLTLSAAIAAITLTLVPTASQPQASTTKTDFEVGRESDYENTPSFYADAEVAQVSADVSAYCDGLAGAPPVLDDLEAWLDALHDRVWQVSSGVVEYTYVLDASGVPIPICRVKATLYVMDPGSTEPVVVSCTTTTTFP